MPTTKGPASLEVAAVKITTTKSSTSVSAIITRPASVFISPRSISNRINTIVLATATMQPTAKLCSIGQPINQPTPTHPD